MDINVILGDIGGAKDVIPVCEKLEKSGHNLRYFVSGEESARAAQELEKRALPYEVRSPNTTDRPNAIVIGTSATAIGAQNEWTRFGKERGIPVIWIEDMYGTGSVADGMSVDPDIMCVMDAQAAEITLRQRPGIKVQICGKPSFKHVRNVLKDESCVQRTRQQLADRAGIKNFAGHIVTFVSSGENPDRVDSHITSLLNTKLERQKNEVLFVPRLHPKLPGAKSREMNIRAQWLDIRSIAAYDLDLIEIVRASDVIICDWAASEGPIAVIMGTPAIITMFGNEDDTNVRISRGYPGGLPPVLAACAAFPASSSRALGYVLKEVLDSLPEHRRIVESNAAGFLPLLSDKAADEIAEVITTAMR